MTRALQTYKLQPDPFPCAPQRQREREKNQPNKIRLGSLGPSVRQCGFRSPVDMIEPGSPEKERRECCSDPSSVHFQLERKHLNRATLSLSSTPPLYLSPGELVTGFGQRALATASMRRSPGRSDRVRRRGGRRRRLRCSVLRPSSS